MFFQKYQISGGKIDILLFFKWGFDNPKYVGLRFHQNCLYKKRPKCPCLNRIQVNHSKSSLVLLKKNSFLAALSRLFSCDYSVKILCHPGTRTTQFGIVPPYNHTLDAQTIQKLLAALTANCQTCNYRNQTHDTLHAVVISSLHQPLYHSSQRFRKIHGETPAPESLFN